MLGNVSGHFLSFSHFLPRTEVPKVGVDLVVDPVNVLFDGVLAGLVILGFHHLLLHVVFKFGVESAVVMNDAVSGYSHQLVHELRFLYAQMFLANGYVFLASDIVSPGFQLVLP